jgi:hypothetical protein
MTKLVALKRSDKPEKKFMVELETAAGRSKVIHFGDANLKDYTTHPALERDERKRLYLARHRVTENWSDPETAGFWSRWILWNKPTIAASLRDVRARYRL